MKNKIDSLYKKFLDNKDLQMSFFNILCTVIYWAWKPLAQELIEYPIKDSTRFYSVILSISIMFLVLKKWINIHKAGFIVQTFLIFHYGYTMYKNNYHIIYIIGFVLILVLQSLTFKKKQELFTFYVCSGIWSIYLAWVATNNQKLFLYNVSTVLILGPIAAMIRIRSEEIVLKQNLEINNFKIDQMNSKIQQNLSNLSSSLAHEINSPLTTILGYTDILNKNREENKVPEIKSIQKIESQVNKIKEITNMLSLLSSDPKQKNEENAKITAEEIQNYIVTHIKNKFYKFKADFNFNCINNFEYAINKAHFFYILNEVFNLFQNIKGKDNVFKIEFKENSVIILSNSSLQINDLNKMTSQIISNNYRFYLKEVTENDLNGILLYKE